jgi:hypothetical protein
MTYFKGVLVGILATVIAIILWFLGVVFFVVKPALDVAAAASNGAVSNGAVGWDVGSYAEASHLWVSCLLIFMAGLIWEFRRARRLA